MATTPEKSEAYFRALFENAAELITVVDATGAITYENPSNANFIGYTREEMLGRNVFSVMHPDDVPAVQAAFAAALPMPGPAPTIRFRLRHKDGSWRWLESYGNNLLANPDVKGIVVNSRDITEEVHQEERIKELAALRAKFVTIVAHQMRTPLSVIRWNLEALAEGTLGPLTPTQVEHVKATLAADVAVISRINDMLTAIDIEEGRTELKMAETPLEDIGLRILGDLEKACKAKGIRLSYEGPKTFPTVLCDADKIRRVFKTFADNAVSYTKEGGRVSIRVSEQDGRIRFEIEDTGIGVPKADQEKIFGRFFRASNASVVVQDADGVSLSIAKHFVERHGGTVGFASEEGKGSTFWFEIPLKG